MNIKKTLLLLSLSSSIIYAGGYKIPITSLNSVALATAYNASSYGADSSYYNPANMSFNEDKNYLEVSIHSILLPRVSYTSNTNSFFDSKSKKESVTIPTLHFSSKDINNFRYGLSIVSPFGLSKRWDTPLQKASVEEFTLNTIELNPTISYKINPQISLGGGIRIVYGSGVVKSDSSILNTLNAGVPSLARNMEGDSIAYGFNTALSYKVNSALQLGVTYRSKIDLKLKGNAKLYSNGTLFYDGKSSVSVPLPASLNIAITFKPLPSTTIELSLQRTYWSAFKELDFSYETTQSVFDDPVEKNWKDSNTYAIGITHQYNKSTKLMFGFAIDETPIVDETIDFSLPSADGKFYSCGLQYNINNTDSVGIAYLFNDREKRNSSVLGGTIKASVHNLTLAYKYNF